MRVSESQGPADLYEYLKCMDFSRDHEYGYAWSIQQQDMMHAEKTEANNGAEET